MKKVFITPEIELIYFGETEVIMTSMGYDVFGDDPYENLSIGGRG